MKIRAITLYVCCNSFESVLEEVRAASASAASLAAYFTELGYEVQTTRLALNSFEEWVRNEDPVDCVKELVGLLDELKVISTCSTRVSCFPPHHRFKLDVIRWISSTLGLL